MASFIGLVKRLHMVRCDVSPHSVHTDTYQILNAPAVLKSQDSKPIKFGILGAAAIAPPGIIWPAKNHPEAIVYAVAARDKNRATAYAKKHGIEKVYGGPSGYQGDALRLDEKTFQPDDLIRLDRRS